ncbi:MAG: hypothetical protein GC160_25610 [Acidobacteria bacterium]|nr:hypothetical protein [Acidobacteriota bacterium]
MNRNRPRLLVLGLDAFDPAVASRLKAEGRLPALERLESRSRRFSLDPGPDRYTGLAWDHFSSGLRPEESRRWSAVSFEPAEYQISQPTTRSQPFTERLDTRTVVFDVPYFDLREAAAGGMVSWGAHDPGVEPASRPTGLADEILEKFGPYPASDYVYGHVWPDAEATRAMAAAMVAAVERRAEITSWLLTQRLPGWDLAMAVVGEYHSATEAFWHGWEESHPLHGLPSAEPARQGLVAVYEALDRMLGRLLDELGDTPLLAFTPHGMGRNLADVPAMLLLPELLYRNSTGKQGFTPDPRWPLDGSGGPGVAEAGNWSEAVLPRLHIEGSVQAAPWWRFWAQPEAPLAQPSDYGLHWMPATRYREAWPAMKAFALPSYYDARVRVNLEGREGRGIVPHGRYREALDEVAALLESCRDPRSGEPLEIDIERRLQGDPMDRDSTDADLVVRFRKDYYAFDHPSLGRIGPAPCRRTGGHTGGLGVGYHWAPGVTGSPDLGLFETLDVPGAVAALTGAAASNRLAAALTQP